jgi:hypothetical protein
MSEKISSPVSVYLVSDHKKSRVYPKTVLWNNRSYSIDKVGLHHTFRQGRTLFHVFSVSTKSLFLRLVLNTENLHWKLEEISDEMLE